MQNTFLNLDFYLRLVAGCLKGAEHAKSHFARSRVRIFKHTFYVVTFILKT